MRRLRLALRRRSPALDLTPEDLRRTGGSPADLTSIAAAVEGVARYVGALKRAVGALRPSALATETVPGLRAELAEVGAETERASLAIMAAVEATLDYDGAEAGFREHVEDRLVAVIEACAFADVAGQRLARAASHVDLIGEGLRRLVDSTRIEDGPGGIERSAVLREVRREVLLVEGPQTQPDVEQPAVDRLFA